MVVVSLCRVSRARRLRAARNAAYLRRCGFLVMVGGNEGATRS